MPECPVCRTPYEEGLRLCQSCGASLLSPELRPALCPRCGARVSSEQEYCQECHWPLAIEPSEKLRAAFPEPPRFTLVSLVKHLWFHGFLVGLGVVIIISLALLFFKGTPTPPAPKEREVTAVPSLTPPTQVAPGQPGTGQTTPPVGSADANAVLKVQLEEVLANLREANLNKDLTRFLNLYSPAFPQREKKGQDISKVWKAYDYLAMGFRIDEVKPLGVDRAYARVTWNIKTQDRNTKNLKDVTRTYQVWFAKESNQWRIRALDKGK